MLTAKSEEARAMLNKGRMEWKEINMGKTKVMETGKKGHGIQTGKSDHVIALRKLHSNGWSAMAVVQKLFLIENLEREKGHTSKYYGLNGKKRGICWWRMEVS